MHTHASFISGDGIWGAEVGDRVFLVFILVLRLCVLVLLLD